MGEEMQVKEGNEQWQWRKKNKKQKNKEMGAKIYFVLFFKKREKSRRMNEKKFKDFQKQMTSISKKKKSSILKEKKINFQG